MKKMIHVHISIIIYFGLDFTDFSFQFSDFTFHTSYTSQSLFVFTTFILEMTQSMYDLLFAQIISEPFY